MRLTAFTCGSRVEPRWESSECLRRRIATLEQENAALVEEVKAHKAVTEDPQVLWANWLRGTAKLPAGIGDIRQSEERVKRLEEVGDALFNIAGKIGHGLFVAETKDAWTEAKATP
jgi:hypothetical protein